MNKDELYKIKYSSTAVNDILDIKKELNKNSWKVTERFLFDLKSRIKLLAMNPGIYSDDLFEGKFNLKRLEESYYMFYKVFDESKEIEVHRFLKR